MKKKSSENDQSFSELFYLFFSSPDPIFEKNPINQLIKKFWPYFTAKMCIFLRQEEVGGIDRIEIPCNHSKQRDQHLKALLIHFMQF